MSTPNKHFFYNITRKTIVQFLDIFNNIDIARYDDVGRIKKYVKVPIKFAPKTKQWYWKELKDNHDRRDSIFPMMSINLEGMAYASERQVARHARISSFDDNSKVRRYYNPTPYDYTFRVLIVSQYMVDIMQIVEQILPNFSPEAYIRLTVPELNITGLSENGEAGSDKLDLRVTYEGSQKDTPVELDEEAFRVITWELTFKVQGYLFSPVTTSGIIHKVVQNYYISDESWSKRGQDIGAELPVTNIRMYATPFGGDYDYPVSVRLRSFDPVDEIYWSLTGDNYQLYDSEVVITEDCSLYYYGVTSESTSPIYISVYNTVRDDDYIWDSITEIWDSLNINWNY